MRNGLHKTQVLSVEPHRRDKANFIRFKLQNLIRNNNKKLAEKGRAFGDNLTNLCPPAGRKTKREAARECRHLTVSAANNSRSLSSSMTIIDTYMCETFAEDAKPCVATTKAPAFQVNFRNPDLFVTKTVPVSGVISPQITGRNTPSVKREKTDPQLCEEYGKEIDKYLREIEGRYAVNPNYLHHQPEITSEMHAILVNWLVEVHLRFKLVPETLFLAVCYTDRYLAQEVVTRNRLQLVGLTSLFIASKYEEIYPPELCDFVRITNNAYSKKEILNEERKILVKLGFNLNIPSSYRFLARYCVIFRVHERTRFLSQYFLELSLLESAMLKYSASVKAAAAYYLSTRLLDQESNWNTRIGTQLGYQDRELRDCAKDFLRLYKRYQTSVLKGVVEKFSRPAFLNVASIKIGRKK